jgi:hypothetical protein
MTAVHVPGRPHWVRDEPLEVQRLVVEHRLNQSQLRALREFTDGPERPRGLPHSTARALRSRGLGDISSKQLNHRTLRGHPRAEFVLNEKGRAVVAALLEADPGFIVERVSTNLTKVTITQPGVFGFTAPLRLAEGETGEADAAPEGGDQ